MKIGILVAVWIFAGCALQPRTAKEQADVEYRRANDRVETAERFQRLKGACKTAVVVSSDRGRIGELTVDEMKLATCPRPH